MRVGIGLMGGFALALTSASCTWITPAELESARGSLDDDQDGYDADTDCDDADPDIYPGAPDTWYDGIDANCAGDDDFDADQDSYVADADVGQTTLGVETSGLLDGGDCNDADAASNPSRTDTWYDGIDTNCDGLDDFDADSDGYASSQHDYVETTNAAGTGGLEASDCDDGDTSINPAAVEIWYDGIDQDCLGDDDFDADGDGWLPEEWVEDLETTDADCDDTDSEVNPTATEVWYDGVDQDCDGASDYDADQDGYDSDAYDGDDCNDLDSDIHPAAPEILLDSADSDCDGGNDTFSVSPLEDFAWTGPHSLRWDENSTDIFLAASSDEVTYVSPGATSSTTLYQSILVLDWSSQDLEAGLDSVIQFQRNAADPGWTLAPSFEMIAKDEAIYGTFGFRYTSSGSRGLRLAAYTLDTVGRKGSSHVPGAYEHLEDLSIAEDSEGNLHAIGCESSDGLGQHIWAAPETLADNDNNGTESFDFSADLCRLHFYEDDPTGTVVASTANGLEVFTFERPDDDAGIEALDSASTYSSYAPLDIEIPRETSAAWIVFADDITGDIVFLDDTGTETTQTISGGVMSVDVRVAPDGNFVLAYVDGSGQAGVLLGHPDLGFSSLPLDPGFTATDAAAHVDDDGVYLLVAVAGTDELAVGTALLP